MKKANFSLEKFASSNVKTLNANDLNLVIGSYSIATNQQCSVSNDTDPGRTNCSQTNDTDPIVVKSK